MRCWAGACRAIRSGGFRSHAHTADEVIVINVGGTQFAVSYQTLARCPETSALRLLLASQPSPDGTYFLDRDSSQFRHVLNFLRDGPDLFVGPSEPEARQLLKREATFLGLSDLADKIDTAYRGAPLPSNEASRIARLDGLRIMHTDEHEERYDSITKVVADLLRMPIVLVSLVHSDHQWFKSRCGLEASQTSRATSFCAFTFTPTDSSASSMFLIEDARSDPRVQDNPLVTGPPRIVFYAGSPLVTSDGFRLGAFCCIDRVQRKLTPAEAQLVVNFSSIVSMEIEREQLQGCPGAPHEEEFGAVDRADFAQEMFRTYRMRSALKEAIVFVHIPQEGVHCQILWSSHVWSQVTGASMRPPEFGSEVNAQANGTGSGAPWDKQNHSDRQASIWEWLHVDGRTIEATVDCIRDACQRDDPVCARLHGSLRLGPSTNTTATRAPVSCRVTPAELPLDVNAATIAPQPPRHSMPCAENRLSCEDGGCYCFIQLLSPDQQWQELLSDGIQTATGSRGVAEAVMHAKAGTLTSADGRFAREEASKVDPSAKVTTFETPTTMSGGTGLQSMRFFSKTNSEAPPNKEGSGIDAVHAIRPPRSPFVDVQLIHLAGSGSFGKVYYGNWMGSPVAVKVISVASAQQRMSPIFEGAVSELVSHPNLVQTYQCSTRAKQSSQDGVEAPDMLETWIVQEWCEQGTLGSLCDRPRLDRQSLFEVLDICKDIAAAGAYLHHRGIIHGDLTSNNVLIKMSLSPKGYTCKICDFGLARILVDESCEICTTQLGTVTHMPPELLRPNDGEARLTMKVDTWAAGVLLWQALTGKTPFAGLSPPQIVIHVASGCRLKMPEVPPGIKAIYDCCCAANPETRASFDDILAMLAMAERELTSMCDNGLDISFGTNSRQESD